MKILVIFILLFQVGCSTLGEKFNNAERAPNDKALIYFYRPYSLIGYLRSPDVVFRGKKVGALPSGGYLLLKTEPGTAKIYPTFSGAENGEFEISVDAGKVYFVRFEPGAAALTYKYDFSGTTKGENCPYMGANIVPNEEYINFIKKMDKRAQTTTCWPGFMAVTADFAKIEILETKRVK